MMRRALMIGCLFSVSCLAGFDSSAAPIVTSKVCQLTGADDRDMNHLATGAELTGVTGGVTGTDIGFSFEYGQRLHFLFGDSRAFGRDLCEPRLCGTADRPKVLAQSDTTFVQRWRDQDDWNRFSGPDLNASPRQYPELYPWQRGDGWDSRASAPLNFDPDHCIPLTFAVSRLGIVYSQAWDGSGIAGPEQWSGPAVAANPQDKWVFPVGNRILVITSDGRVFAHQTHGLVIDPAVQLAAPKVAANPGDKWVLMADNRILVITADGRVFAHSVNGNTIAPAYQLTAPAIAAQPVDRQVIYQNGRIYVITASGAVFAHVVEGDTIQSAQQLQSPPVATNAVDRWVLPFNGDIAVVTKNGSVYVHKVTATTVQPAYQLAGALIIPQPRTARVLVDAGNFLVLTGADGSFVPTVLDGLPLGRNEGAFSAFVNGNTVYTFFTRLNRPVGCKNPAGCAHADDQPGGKLVLAQSSDGGASSTSLSTVSVTRFLFGVPVTVPAAELDGLPSDVSETAVLLFGAGRQGNDQLQGAAPWNHSPPFLAVASAASRSVQDGRVFAHDVTATDVSPAIQLQAPIVAAQPADRWVLALAGRILVITLDGRVFAHSLGGSVVQPAYQLAGANVGANAGDKYVLAMGQRILVITADGRVFAHDINGDTVGSPFQLTSPKVAANAVDREVLVLGNRILVITASGQVFAHAVDGNVVQPAIQLAGPPVAARAEDRRVLVMDQRLLVTTQSGAVFAHQVQGDTIAPATQLSGPEVAARPEDRWVLANGGRLLVITGRQAWHYFGGLRQDGHPVWVDDESLAQALPPFARQQPGGYDECLGYFSVRYIDSWRKWAMLYTCNLDPTRGYDPNNSPRGVLLRTADKPWGPWSAALLVFRPADGYCAFMHFNAACAGPGQNANETNPLEESVRDATDPSERASGGEYAPFLLPARYVKTDPGGTTFYFEMSTWNPYQVVLLRARLPAIP